IISLDSDSTSSNCQTSKSLTTVHLLRSTTVVLRVWKSVYNPLSAEKPGPSVGTSSYSHRPWSQESTQSNNQWHEDQIRRLSKDSLGDGLDNCIHQSVSGTKMCFTHQSSSSSLSEPTTSITYYKTLPESLYPSEKNGWIIFGNHTLDLSQIQPAPDSERSKFMIIIYGINNSKFDIFSRDLFNQIDPSVTPSHITKSTRLVGFDALISTYIARLIKKRKVLDNLKSWVDNWEGDLKEWFDWSERNLVKIDTTATNNVKGEMMLKEDYKRGPFQIFEHKRADRQTLCQMIIFRDLKTENVLICHDGHLN
ncbi:hypothetical protein PPACK8108_LOCUS2816, partial [Phakopsora pachyrhizi]